MSIQTESHVFQHADQLELFKAHADGIDSAFYKFHDDNPQVYASLKRMARAWKLRGMRHLGMKMLFEVLRWQVAMKTRDPTGLKLNNNMTSRYARLLMQQECCSTTCEGCGETDCFAGLFEVRELHTPSDLKVAA